MKAVWYYNRLISMSLPELFYRAKQVAVNKYNKYLRKKKVFYHVNYLGTKAILDQGGIESALTNYVFNHSFRIFNRSIDLHDILDWHTDINSGLRFEKIYSRDINTRTHPARSAKFVWEINRLQFLTQISLEYRKTHNEIYLDLFLKHLDSWIDDNPYLIGVNWYSNIELNIRLITWFLCWEILRLEDLMVTRPALREFVLNKWIPVIYAHCKHTYRNLSRYSSSNNHLISEYAGLFVASSFWNFKDSLKWNNMSKKGLEKEIITQHTADGINREQTTEYIQFITDFFLISYVVGEKLNNKFSADYIDMLGKIFDYIYNLMDSKGNMPRYGDADDGRAFILETEPLFNNFRSLLISGVIIHKNGRWKSLLNGIDSKNLILFGEESIDKIEKVESINPELSSSFYPDSGHFIMKSLRNSKEIFAHFNAAPLGFLSIAAHGHADALSFILHVNGQPFLIDPGTFSYHTHMEYRDYFKGTLAHNTIRINRENQATIGGPTMWKDHYNVKLLSITQNQQNDSVTASHDGYSKKYGITHTRTIELNKYKECFLITDVITCQNAQEKYFLEFSLHLHPEIEIVSLIKNKISLSSKTKNIQVVIKLDEKLDFSVFSGSEKPLIGWYSHSFNCLKETSSIYALKQFSGGVKLFTEIEIV